MIPGTEPPPSSSEARFRTGSKFEANLEIPATERSERPVFKLPPNSARSFRTPKSAGDGGGESEEGRGSEEEDDGGGGARKVATPRSWRVRVWERNDESFSPSGWREVKSQDIVWWVGNAFLFGAFVIVV